MGLGGFASLVRGGGNTGLVGKAVEQLGECFGRVAFPLLSFAHDEDEDSLRVFGGVEFDMGSHR